MKLPNKTLFIKGFLFFFLIKQSTYLKAQEFKDLELSGKPIVAVYADYTAGLGKANDVSGFNMARSRLGYRLQIGNALTSTIVLNINTDEEGNRTVNFFFAMLEWNYKNLTLGGGIVALTQFREQETFWGRRYIEKSYQDLNRFGAGSDLGIVLKYRFNDWLNADFSVTNGEGRLKSNNNNSNKYGFGITAKPFNGFTLRAYGDIYTKSEDLYPTNLTEETVSFKNQGSMAFFAGYRNSAFSLGAEFNKQVNRSFVNGCDYQGYSVYTGVRLNSTFELFGRYDYVETDTPDNVTYNWLSVANKNTLIAGLEYHPIKQLYISPNYRYIESLAGEGSHSISLNLGFNW